MKYLCPTQLDSHYEGLVYDSSMNDIRINLLGNINSNAFWHIIVN